ncbi:hypothetical protein JXC34_02185 [Candidatus Woesearchaeota archaeon]|nr:hypothetical protein [Candidatus Woesearchaeota archaeon]
MKTPQEIIVWYVLPALRRELALSLKRKGMKQKEIALVIGVTEPAVSQYLKSKRANDIEFNREIIDEIKNAANQMTSDMTCHRYELQHLLNLITRTGELCEIHRRYDDVPACCNVCINQNKGDLECKSI